MKYQTRKVKHLTDLQLLAQLHLGAKIYSKYAESALLLIFGGGKTNHMRRMKFLRINTISCILPELRAKH